MDVLIRQLTATKAPRKVLGTGDHDHPFLNPFKLRNPIVTVESMTDHTWQIEVVVFFEIKITKG